MRSHLSSFFSSFFLGLSLITISLPSDLVSALPVSQSRRSPKTALEQVLISQKLESKWFNPKVLEKFPLSKLQEMLEELKAHAKAELGDYKSVQLIKDDTYRVLFERGVTIATIRLDPNGGITAIAFDNPEKF
jgi:hypothetical protein